ncbi:thymidylate synthase [Pseudoalteromonas luteoviolacea]|uniref:Thymidylate synthase n=1 Tax=Pseudoalteromonas luteoviolacea S4054 TaxID=1129367 RepID=A0A0F6AA69_9GAMM|nr:thymidylate synthase [Pseudoalteromonas luteoviolacea]AOT09398.1 thymidylate synthase [Pseudoalteromonas luteoviolacea]AOT14310.1 thymidylate synthase [Pseudoalteromonas luteoviolacea]AOT19226.1 thymidylate synthase [Pseudoalteromonas luteoviolacea]KKE83075.1 thymidylate synthase [Pseudoalteromonas luteoviolacea S4054]KZN73415.1 thymidylate synthase [Pseudoalteromonas luteoviolacea S4047-1]
MSQYLDLCQRIVDEGKWVENKRTGKRCLTVINADLTYHVDKNEFPLDTTRKSFWKAAIAELLGYLRGYDSAAQFREIGCNTWNANANENQDWLKNPNRKGEDDMGFVYGAVARNFPKPDGGSVDLVKQVIDDLSKGIDNRGEIITFYHPGSFHLGCLRPCMFQHQFSILDGVLYLNSYQRSQDVPLGGNFNAIQVFTLLKLVAQITGLEAGKAFHKIVNAHIYEDQLELMRDVQLKRTPFASPQLHINPEIKTFEDLETWVTLDDFEVTGYQHHDAIQYPFSV